MGGVVKAVTKVVSTVAPALSGISPFASLAMKGFSMLQARKSSKKASAMASRQVEIQEKAEKQKQRYNQLQAQRERIQQRRAARMKQGEILAQAGSGGLGMGGSSSVTGGLGSVSTQMGSNIGDINVAEGFAQQQGDFNVAAAQAGNKMQQAQTAAAGWQQMGSLAGDFSIPDIFGTKNEQSTSKPAVAPKFK